MLDSVCWFHFSSAQLWFVTCRTELHLLMSPEQCLKHTGGGLEVGLKMCKSQFSQKACRIRDLENAACTSGV